MSKPRALDLFSGAGGASMGLRTARQAGSLVLILVVGVFGNVKAAQLPIIDSEKAGIVRGFNSFLELPSLPGKNAGLNNGYSNENPSGKRKLVGGADKPIRSLNEWVLIRRTVVAIVGGLACFGLGLRGWQYFDNKRPLLGSALIATGGLLALGGYGLLGLTDFSWTWDWWL